MTHPILPPTETPPAEGWIAEPHQERADGGIWGHPYFWVSLIAVGSVLVAGYYLARGWGW